MMQKIVLCALFGFLASQAIAASLSPSKNIAQAHEWLKHEAARTKGIVQIAQEIYQRTLADLNANAKAILNKLKNIKQEQAPWARIPDEIPFNEATIVGSHESFQSTVYGYNFGQALHTQSITQQLQAGVRYLDLRLWDYKNDVYLCHGSCTGMQQNYLMPSRKFTLFASVLKEIYTFLDKNPDDVVIISLGGGIGQIPDKETLIDKKIEESGLANYTLMPSEWDIIGKKEWPTYGWLRKNNKRVIFAMEGYNYIARYIYPSLFAKPNWQEIKIDQDVPRLLVLSIGVEMPSDATPERIVAILTGKESNQLFGGIYSLDYLLRSLGFLRGKGAAPMAALNTALPYKYARYIHDNGFGDNHLWKGQLPAIIASDFVAQGDMFGAAQCINKTLRGWDAKGITYPTSPTLDCARFQ